MKPALFVILAIVSLNLTLFVNCSSFRAGNVTGKVGQLSGSTGVPGSTPSPSTDSNSYYVAASGSDSNSGLDSDHPLRTINKINSMTFKPGDEILFLGGDSFTGCLNLSPVNVPDTTAADGLSIGTYGSGPFTLNSNCTGTNSAAIKITNLSGISITNANLRGYSGGADGTACGILIYNTDPANVVMSGISITHSDIGGFYTTDKANTCAEIQYLVYNSTLPDSRPFRQIYIADNFLHGLIGPNSPDDNGIAGHGHANSANGMTIERNVVENIGGLANGGAGSEGNGIIMLGATDTLIQFNVAHDLAANVNTCGGAAGIWTADGNNVVIQFNESYRVQPSTTPSTDACDWDGFDLDYRTKNSVLQYNYSHDNYGTGYLLYGTAPWGPNTVRYNVSFNDARNSASAARAQAVAGISFGGSGAMPILIYNNSIYQMRGVNAQGTNPSLAISTLTQPTGLIANNLFYHDAVNSGGITTILRLPSSSAVSFANNDYFSSLYSPQSLASSLDVLSPSYVKLNKWMITADGDALAKFVDPGIATSGPVTCFTATTPASPNDLAQCLKNNFPAVESSSGLRGIGLDLTANPYSLSLGGETTGYSGSQSNAPIDFFNHVLGSSPGTGYNIGADGR